ncbi:MAG: ferritin [Clostridia bacterium]|jgi:ferritin|nr:ferritin [Clostridia bacterium]
MLNDKIAKLINEQVNKELYSGYLYLDFSNYYADAGLDGFAHWYEIQAQEERDHAMMMRRYLIDNGYRVTFAAIAKPDKTFADTTAPLKAGFEHEQYVTSLINNIYAEAFGMKDFKTMQFLDWFIKEQGEEEKNAEDLIKKMELFGHDAKGLYALNQELAARVYAPSTTGPAM